jgi:predicted nucleotidyltransferase
VVKIKLFGSKARGEDTPDSDIDLLVIVKDERWEIKHAMLIRGARLSLEHEVLFNLHIISQDRWDWMKRVKYPLYRTIMEDGVEIEFDSISGR